MEKNHIKSSPRDVFMHIFMIVLLYMSAASFLTIAFQSINILFPDAVNQFRFSGAPDQIRWAISAIVVIFPVFLWASRFLRRDIANNPEKADLRIRKWLLYFTIFAAAGFIIGDIVSLVYNFLQGELTLRFILKVLFVLLVAAAVFWYYLSDLRRKAGEFAQKEKIFLWAVIVIVIISVIVGFLFAGSPFKQRLIRFDDQRVGDLQILQGQILNYWMQKDRLPASLDDLRDSISGFVPPRDPQTTAPYTYRTTGDLSFELCANFNLSSEETLHAKGRYPISYPAYPAGPYYDPGVSAPESWDHPAGEHCFTRTIDPELYRPSKPR